MGYSLSVQANSLEQTEEIHLMAKDLLDELIDTVIASLLVKTKPLFTAFIGDMPITQEFRLFTKDGKVEGWQPYWPLKAFEGQRVSIDNVKDALESISTPSQDLLDQMIEYANRVSGKLDGDWSVDFLIDKNGRPVLIDMAEAHKSFKCDAGYVELPKPVKRLVF